MKSFAELTALGKRLFRSGQYKISYHVLYDHPERRITVADIIECIKIGAVADLEPREVEGQTKYQGAQRYRWFGEDMADRVLRLIVVIEDNLIIVSAAIATENQEKRYREEDRHE